MFGCEYAKDLTGFIDGTRNPDHLLRAIVDEIIILPDDEIDDLHIGGSYLYTGRFVHNLKKFFNMPDEDKSNIIGRVYGKETPHKGYDTRPENPRYENAHQAAHVFRGFGAMYRHAYPYRYEQEEGLFFTSYSRSLEEIESAINRMAGQFEEDGSPDNLLSISRNVSSNYFYVPGLEELKSLTIVRPIPESKIETDLKGKEPEVIKDVVIFIEYCTNCGYNTIFNEKRKILEAVSNRVRIVGNPHMPRQSSFEVTTQDGIKLWSKLDQLDGRNNDPVVFPTNEQLTNALQDYLKLPRQPVTIPKSKFYSETGARIGVW